MPSVSVNDLLKIRDRYKYVFAVRDVNHKVKIVVHLGICGIAAGARRVVKAFLDAIKETGYLDAAISIAGCEGNCQLEPIVDIYIEGKEKVRYVLVDAQKAKTIFDRHILCGEFVEEFIYREDQN